MDLMRKKETEILYSNTVVARRRHLQNIGQRWSRIKRLGKGEYGSVFLGQLNSSPHGIEIASSENLPRLFAVKSAAFNKSDTLVHERDLFHQLRDCSSIINCYGADVSQEEGQMMMYHLFLEFASGGSLADRIYHSAKPLDEVQVRKHTRSVLLGLSHMHSKGIAHCDIKPGNILLVEDGDDGHIAKIGDLGLAILGNRTDTENVIGTVSYLAPESVLHGHYGPPADIWALGCTVFEMLFGKRLRKVGEIYELYMDTLSRQEAPEIPLGISIEARDFLVRCLDLNPLNRWDAHKLLVGSSFIAHSNEFDIDVGKIKNRGRDLSHSEDTIFCKKPKLDHNSSELFQPFCLH